MKKILFCVVIIFIISCIVFFLQVRKLQEKYNSAVENMKTYDSILSNSEEETRALKLTIEQFKYFNDSVLDKLDETRKELKIKDSKIKSLQYMVSDFSKKDTVRLKDTIFKEPNFRLDTTLGDQWYKVRIGLEYPSTVAVNPEFKSEKHIIVSSKKETINPPKKFWLFRLFQKKHTVLNVDVVEKNPYVENQTSRYIEIIK